PPTSPAPIAAPPPLREPEPEPASESLPQAQAHATTAAPAATPPVLQPFAAATVNAAVAAVAEAITEGSPESAAYDGTAFMSPCSLSVLRDSASFNRSTSCAHAIEAGRALASLPPPPVFALELTLSSPNNCAVEAKPDMALSVLLESTAT